MSILHLSVFYQVIRNDNRITTAHISVFMALFERWSKRGFEGPVAFKRQELMESAKISGLATYHKCIRDLEVFGYIRYLPSFNPAKCSQVYILVGQ